MFLAILLHVWLTILMMLYLLEIRFLCRTLAQRDVIFQEAMPGLCISLYKRYWLIQIKQSYICVMTTRLLIGLWLIAQR